MNKTALVLVLMLTLIASAMAEVYPVEYTDNSCEWVKHGWIWVHECDEVSKETSVNVPQTDLTPVEDRLYTLEHDGGFGYTSFIRAMHEEVLDWLKGIFTQNNDFEAYKLEQEQINREQNKRIFACESALGMTEGY